MERYEILEHTADLKIRVFGHTKEELFENALIAMCDSLKPVKSRDKTEKEIIIDSMSPETLLIDFLAECLYQIQANKEVYEKAVFEELKENQLRAKLVGQKIESFGEDIKAVTYHGTEIKETEKGLEAIILFDV